MVDASSKRLHERVRQYWQSVRENRPYPREEEIDPHAIPDAWDFCFLVDMRRGHTDKGFKYQYMGKELIDAYGANMTGMELKGTEAAPHITSIMSHFNQVAESGEPSMDESEFTNLQNMRVKYRCCLLPIGKDKVELILGCMRWKSC